MIAMLGWFSEARVLASPRKPEPLGVVRERLGQHLDRDVAVQLGITRPIDFAHPPTANGLDQGEDAEAGAGSEGHGYFRRLYWREGATDGIGPRTRASKYLSIFRRQPPKNTKNIGKA